MLLLLRGPLKGGSPCESKKTSNVKEFVSQTDTGIDSFKLPPAPLPPASSFQTHQLPCVRTQGGWGGGVGWDGGGGRGTLRDPGDENKVSFEIENDLGVFQIP